MKKKNRMSDDTPEKENPMVKAGWRISLYVYGDSASRVYK